jgi:hypothetical protein
MTSIVYQAYGRNEAFYQMVYSIKTLLQKSESKNFRIIIYTDKIDFAKKFFNANDPIQYENLSPEQMIQWKGAINFNHRMKIEILKDCSKKYDGNILYLDGDTYFTKDIAYILANIKEDQSVMHIAEQNLTKTKDYLAKKLYKFLRKNKITVQGKEVILPANFVMWNAGVIGIHRKHHSLFQEIIDYTDELFSKYPKHLMEQYAVSYYLQKVSSLVPCEDSLEHYWNQKDSFEEAIIPFFEKNQTAQDYEANKQHLVLPVRYYGRPKYTFKQKLKRKIIGIKYRLGMQY